MEPIWSCGKTGHHEDVYGHILNVNGGPSGSRLPIAASSGANETLPDAAWSDVANAYLVIWQEGTGTGIGGQRLDAAVAPLGDTLAIATGSYTPAVAATPDEWLVVWRISDLASDLYGQAVAIDGARP